MWCVSVIYLDCVLILFVVDIDCKRMCRGISRTFLVRRARNDSNVREVNLV